jgi:hypothetical protein
MAITWARFEGAVLQVFAEALRRLAQLQRLPAAEEPINLELYWLLRKSHLQLLQSAEGCVPFSIMADTTNQPEPDDSARSKRMKKRPDFSCVITNSQASDFRKSQVLGPIGRAHRVDASVTRWYHCVTRCVRAGGWGSMPQGHAPELQALALLWCRSAPPQPPGRVLPRDPDLADGVVPDSLHVEDADGLPVRRAVDPGANGNAC